MVGYRKGDPDFPLYQFPDEIPLKVTLAEILGGKVEFQSIKRKKNTSIVVSRGQIVEKPIGFTLRVGGRKSAFGDKHAWDCYMVNGEWRYLSVSEACRLQGIRPDFYEGIDIPETEMWKQTGNAMTVDVIGAVIANLVFNGRTLGRQASHITSEQIALAE
jgi:DNA (cytosine-5)-methyltransferase 1